ncbi:SPOR domain-containing protein [Novosphingobium sp. MBES04]|uniref:SPOR domain-containing protein n=1 Tax=Novosphingobium sp. MBES04 TaxID=1206458 RepID=UPI00057D97BB|nr:SPOR domain-containing protein [Novosphingobium sp. MBES04]
MRLPVKRTLSLFGGLAGSILAPHVQAQDTHSARTGPAADYPMVIGEPFTIDRTVWTPRDQLNYDAVGVASVAQADTSGITAAHKTLPLPSYVEVTDLQSGHTILVRLEERGPMANSRLIELSRGAAQQLGISPGSDTPVRVRRVNPPEPERAALRQGGEAPRRMDTPQGLLEVLRKKLAGQSPLLPPPSTPPTPPKLSPGMMGQGGARPFATAFPAPAAQPKVATAPGLKPETSAKAPSSTASVKPAAPEPVAPSPAKAPVASAASGFVVQVGAFSVEPNARKLAQELGGFVEKPARLWLVRMGPFDNRAKAGAALETARKAGYNDARILHRD